MREDWSIVFWKRTALCFGVSVRFCCGFHCRGGRWSAFLFLSKGPGTKDVHLCLSSYLPVYPSVYLSVYLPINLPLSTYLCNIYNSIWNNTIYIYHYISIQQSINLPVYLSTYLSIYLLAIYPFIYLSTYLSDVYPNLGKPRMMSTWTTFRRQLCGRWQGTGWACLVQALWCWWPWFVSGLPDRLPRFGRKSTNETLIQFTAHPRSPLHKQVEKQFVQYDYCQSRGLMNLTRQRGLCQSYFWFWQYHP